MLANRSIPSSTVIPVLGYADIGEAIAWLCNAFGFTLRLRIGDHRAQLNVGDGAVIIAQDGTASAQCGPQPEATQSVLVRVNNVNAHCLRAQQHGVRILRPPADHPYGERQYTAMDLAGRRWTFSQSIADVDPTEWGGTPGNYNE